MGRAAVPRCAAGPGQGVFQCATSARTLPFWRRMLRYAVCANTAALPVLSLSSVCPNVAWGACGACCCASLRCRSLARWDALHNNTTMCWSGML